MSKLVVAEEKVETFMVAMDRDGGPSGNPRILLVDAKRSELLNWVQKFNASAKAASDKFQTDAKQRAVAVDPDDADFLLRCICDADATVHVQHFTPIRPVSFANLAAISTDNLHSHLQENGPMVAEPSAADSASVVLAATYAALAAP